MSAEVRRAPRSSAEGWPSGTGCSCRASSHRERFVEGTPQKRTARAADDRHALAPLVGGTDPALTRDMLNWKKPLVSGLLGLLLLLGAAPTADAAVVIIRHGPREAPPAMVEEHPAPRRGYVWVGGHHGYRHKHYYWTRGHYVRERRSYDYVPGRWDRHDDHYDWYEGGWRRHR